MVLVDRISLISTQATRVHKQELYLSRKPQNQAKNTRCNAENSKHSPRHDYQLTLHSLSEIQLIVNNRSKIGMKSISK